MTYVNALRVTENQPTGSFVGEFNANDQDANASLRYSLEEGDGSTGNDYFSLDANGTLQTAVSLNYEKNPTFSIRVRVSDEFNDYIEGNFTVEVLDPTKAGCHRLLISMPPPAGGRKLGWASPALHPTVVTRTRA